MNRDPSSTCATRATSQHRSPARRSGEAKDCDLRAPRARANVDFPRRDSRARRVRAPRSRGAVELDVLATGPDHVDVAIPSVAQPARRRRERPLDRCNRGEEDLVDDVRVRRFAHVGAIDEQGSEHRNRDDEWRAVEMEFAEQQSTFTTEDLRADPACRARHRSRERRRTSDRRRP